MSLQREFRRGDANVEVRAELLAGDHWRVRVGDAQYEFRVAALGDGGLRLVPVGTDAGPACVAYGAPAGKGFQVRVDGHTFMLQPPAARRADGDSKDGMVRAPMTGTVITVLCRPGERVAADQTLVVLSAMKMEHKLTAGVAGTVQSVAASDGSTVEQGAVLLVVQRAET
ncbi:MAG TPA: biotin/lipoyl-containing protein [Planctomycetota bacterium]|nr:biotin/lipoyl-containing protein [Planctomycetota bacterium]